MRCLACLTLISLLSVFSAAAPAEEGKKAGRNLGALKALLEAGEKNRKEGKENSAVEAELRRIPELPAIRIHSRKTFKTLEVTSSVIEALADDICVSQKKSQEEVYRMPLAAVVKILDGGRVETPDPKKPGPKKVETADVAGEIIRLTNEFRESQGVPPVKVHPILTKVAQQYAERLLRSSTISHVLDSKGPEDRAIEAGYPNSVGENLSRIGGKWKEGPAKVAVEGWKMSPGHRANLLKADFTHIGVGVALSKRGVWTFCQVFGYDPEKENGFMRFSFENATSSPVVVRVLGGTRGTEVKAKSRFAMRYATEAAMITFEVLPGDKKAEPVEMTAQHGGRYVFSRDVKGKYTVRELK